LPQTTTSNSSAWDQRPKPASLRLGSGSRFSFVKRGWHKAIGFLLIRRCIARRYTGSAAWAEDRAMKLGKVDSPVNDPFVVHLHEVALAYFLVIGNKVLAVGANYLQNMTALYLPAVGVLENLHKYRLA